MKTRIDKIIQIIGIAQGEDHSDVILGLSETGRMYGYNHDKNVWNLPTNSPEVLISELKDAVGLNIK